MACGAIAWAISGFFASFMTHHYWFWFLLWVIAGKFTDDEMLISRRPQEEARAISEKGRRQIITTSRRTVALLAVMLLTVPSAEMRGQNANFGDVAGTVSGPNGAAISRATVKITGVGKGKTTVATTTSTGSFRFALLEPGDYTLSAEAKCVSKGEIKVTVVCDQVTTVSLKLQPTGTATELTAPSCNNPGFEKARYHVIFPARNGFAEGISSERNSFGEGELMPMKLWYSNTTDKQSVLGICGGYSFQSAITVYNYNGRHLLSHDEEKWGEGFLVNCESSEMLPVPPHTCVLEESGYLGKDYELPPGRYKVTAKDACPSPDISANSPIPANAGLTISVGDPPGAQEHIEAILETSEGKITCALFPDRAPATVNDFIELANSYEGWASPESGLTMGTDSHGRVSVYFNMVSAFIPRNGDDRSSLGYMAQDLRLDRPGRLAAWRRGVGLQFFITVAPSPDDEGHPIIFGQCENPEVVNRIIGVQRDTQGQLINPVKVNHITIVR